jgi:hypothetical protein
MSFFWEYPDSSDSDDPIVTHGKCICGKLYFNYDDPCHYKCFCEKIFPIYHDACHYKCHCGKILESTEKPCHKRCLYGYCDRFFPSHTTIPLHVCENQFYYLRNEPMVIDHPLLVKYTPKFLEEWSRYGKIWVHFLYYCLNIVEIGCPLEIILIIISLIPEHEKGWFRDRTIYRCVCGKEKKGRDDEVCHYKNKKGQTIAIDQEKDWSIA